MADEPKVVEVELTNTGRGQHVVYDAEGTPYVILPGTTEKVKLVQPLVDRLKQYADKGSDLKVGGGGAEPDPALRATTGEVLPSGQGADPATKPAGGGGGVSLPPQGEDPAVREAVAEAARKAEDERVRAEHEAFQKSQKAQAEAAAKAQKAQPKK